MRLNWKFKFYSVVVLYCFFTSQVQAHSPEVLFQKLNHATSAIMLSSVGGLIFWKLQHEQVIKSSCSQTVCCEWNSTEIFRLECKAGTPDCPSTQSYCNKTGTLVHHDTCKTSKSWSQPLFWSMTGIVICGIGLKTLLSYKIVKARSTLDEQLEDYYYDVHSEYENNIQDHP